MNEQKLRRFLSDADGEFSFVDCSQLDIRQALREKRRQTAFRVVAFAVVIVFATCAWHVKTSHETNSLRPALTKSDPNAAAIDVQRMSDRLKSLRESLAHERRKMGDLNRMLVSWNDLDFDVTESTSLVDVSYAFHLQKNFDESDLAAKEFERITQDCPGTRGARIAAESLVAFRQP